MGALFPLAAGLAAESAPLPLAQRNREPSVASGAAPDPAPGKNGPQRLVPVDGGLTRWSFAVESAYVFHPVANPFFAAAGRYNKNPLEYHVASQIAAARYDLTNVQGPGFLRGNLQGSAGLLYSAILQGPETFYAGALFGFRYNFVPRGSPWSPYVEVRGGIGWTDSRGFRFAQQQDLTFTYMFGAGVRYDLNSRCRISLGALDLHLSNAYLTQPNYGFDSMGLNVSTEIRF